MQTQIAAIATVERRPAEQQRGNRVRVDIDSGIAVCAAYDIQFAIPVRQNSFLGDYFDEAFDVIKPKARWTASGFTTACSVIATPSSVGSGLRPGESAEMVPVGDAGADPEEALG